MAKQTFTTGQVLTAAQMQSLQNTALGGGDATPKVASYVLVAADAGTTVAMNAAGATTITVNTGLFAAGDTVFIQNRGAGACTVTAGTATVATAGSLILPQNDAGILYFTSASAAIFYDYIQAGAVSPLTTKGDLYTFSTSDARLGVGANGTTLVADSAEATGLKWATASSGGMTLINSGGTALSSNSTTISSIPATYNDLYIVIRGFKPTADGYNTNFRVNGDSGTRYRGIGISGASHTEYTFNGTLIEIGGGTDSGSDTNLQTVYIPDYANTSTWKLFSFDCLAVHETNTSNLRYTKGWGAYNQTGAISSVNFSVVTGTFGGGTVYVYGVK